MALQNLKLAFFEMEHWIWAMYYLGTISLIKKESVLQYWKQKEFEHAYKGWNDNNMPTFNKVDLNKTFELLKECPSREHGVNSCTASYVICPKVQVAINWSKSQYNDLNDEMIGRAMIVLIYQNNNLTEEGCVKHW